MPKSTVKRLKKAIRNESKTNSSQDYPATIEFFKLLSLCNTVVCEYDAKNEDVKYSASSPDELALVEGSA